MKKVRGKKRFTGRHHLDLIPLLVLLLILVLLVIFVVKMKEKTSLESEAASYWSRCRCIGNVWIGERCPNVMRNMPCESGRPTLTPKWIVPSVVESTPRPIKPPVRRWLFF